MNYLYRIRSGLTRTLTGVLALAFLWSFAAPAVQAQIEIRTWDDLNDVRDSLSASYILMNDLDQDSPGYGTYNTVSWVPIGDATNRFTGTFDGNGFTITGLLIDGGGTAGLFGGATGATIKNIGLIDVDIRASGGNTAALVGTLLNTDISNSYATGIVESTTAANTANFGGLVGRADGGTFTNLWTDIELDTGVGCNNAGGLMGFLSGGATLSYSYAKGNVSGDRDRTSGLVGVLLGESVIHDSYATGDVTGTSNRAAGLVGWNLAGTIIRSYSTGAVAGTDAADGLIGGLVADNVDDDSEVIASYWDTETSGMTESDGGEGKTTAEMKDQATFVGWNFTDVWDIDADVNEGYPFLRDDIQVDPDPVEVVLRVNTATVPDTLREVDVVQLRGAISGHDWENDTYLDQVIRWNAQSLLADNIGGDYWEVRFNMLPGDELQYKFWTGFSLDPETQAVGGGWEGGDNRVLAVPANQTDPLHVDLTYYNRRTIFEDKPDTVGIFFRVNVGALVQRGVFNPENEDHKVGVRGSGVLDWGETLIFLDSEGIQEESNNAFYSGAFYVHEDSLAEYNEFEYKFVTTASGAEWESSDNRPVSFTEIADTTLHWVFFSNEAPETGDVDLVEANILFAVNVDILSNLGMFDIAIDAVEVRGNFQGWSGGDELTFNPTLERFQLARNYTGENLVAVGSVYEYKYFIVWDDSREEEESDNYVPGLSLGAGWEEPGTTGGSNRRYIVTDAAEQTVFPADQGYHFYNDLPGAAVIFDELVPGNPETYPITIRIDMSRATTVPEPEERFNPATDSVFIAFEEQIFAITQGFGTGPSHVEGVSNLVRNENYLLKDENGDGIYEITIDAVLPTVNALGFVIGYGQPNIGEGTIRWNGGGYGPGRRYYQFITPTSVDDFEGMLFSTWPAEPELNVLEWQGGEAFGDDPLTVELAPDYEAISRETSTEDVVDAPLGFHLEQNYPNPFNPATTIRFTIPESRNVRLDVYNILGQHVATLVNTQLTAGTHTAQFDATRLASGVYIYRLQSGDFVQQRQMMLIK